MSTETSKLLFPVEKPVLNIDDLVPSQTFEYRGQTITIYDNDGNGQFDPKKDWVEVSQSNPGDSSYLGIRRSSEGLFANNAEADRMLRQQHIHLFKFFSNKPLDQIARYYESKQTAEDCASRGDIVGVREAKLETFSAAQDVGFQTGPALSSWSLYLDRLNRKANDTTDAGFQASDALTTGTFRLFGWT